MAGSGPRLTHADLDEDVLRRLLGILHEDIEVAIVVEDTGIQQLVLHVATIAPSVRLDQIAVGKAACGYLYRYFMYECVGVLSR